LLEPVSRRQDRKIERRTPATYCAAQNPGIPPELRGNYASLGHEAGARDETAPDAVMLELQQLDVYRRSPGQRHLAAGVGAVTA
jgi:hypothetical protein